MNNYKHDDLNYFIKIFDSYIIINNNIEDINIEIVKSNKMVKNIYLTYNYEKEEYNCEKIKKNIYIEKLDFFNDICNRKKYFKITEQEWDNICDILIKINKLKYNNLINIE